MNELLPVLWQTVKEYIPAKDRQAAADHLVVELIDMGIDDGDLIDLAVDKYMINAMKEHVDLSSKDEDDDE